MREPVIKAEQLSKRYSSAGADAGIYAIRGVSLSIHSGEVTVLMGPSGSGKTTLLSMLGGLLAPTAGELSVAGTLLSRCDESRRQAFRRDNVGFVFQSFNLLTALTAEQNVALALKMRGCRQSAAAELLAQVGLSGKAASLPEHLSGGQRQRVAIARALAGDPPVLLADEPTASLDAEQGRVVMSLMRRRAHENGTAVVVVTHDDRVRSFADRVIELQDGQLRRVVRRVRIQSPKSVYAREITHAGT